jgi:phosphotriesterase-related protein
MSIPYGQAITVLGPVPASELGVTLMHEHILNDCRCWWHQPKEKSRHRLACESVNPGILGELRMDPFVNLDNLSLDDERLAIAELALAADEGCRTIVDPTCRGIGRNPEALVRIARATGLNVIMGAGYYLDASHPPALTSMSADDIAAEIARDATEGVNAGGVRIGLIGEIGISADFTPAEQKSLRGAARAARITGLPLMVHLPGWVRHGGRVLDIIEEEGADPRRTVLCHMNPSHSDPAYQEALVARGAFIEYDMIGMDFWYADQGVQCPSDEENARAIAGLVARGHVTNLLLSQDVFLKMMLTRNGGFGYAYLQRHFLPRLLRHGVSASAIRTMMITNPCRLFGGDREET